MLYHFSEDPTIERFVPRPPLAHPETEPMVWAIDDWHSPLYFVPSDCPRVCFWPLVTTTEEDFKRFWPDPDTRMVIAIEDRWYDRLMETAITRYSFTEESFIDCQDHGVFVSRTPVVPVKVESLGPTLEALVSAKVELRLCPSLVALAEQVMETSLHFSLIRMRNAVGWTRPPGGPTVPEDR